MKLKNETVKAVLFANLLAIGGLSAATHPSEPVQPQSPSNEVQPLAPAPESANGPEYGRQDSDRPNEAARGSDSAAAQPLNSNDPYASSNPSGGEGQTMESERAHSQSPGTIDSVPPGGEVPMDSSGGMGGTDPLGVAPNPHLEAHSGGGYEDMPPAPPAPQDPPQYEEMPEEEY